MTLRWKSEESLRIISDCFLFYLTYKLVINIFIFREEKDFDTNKEYLKSILR